MRNHRNGHGVYKTIILFPIPCAWPIVSMDCHNLLQSPGVINLESCQLQIPQVISCCILSLLSHRSMLKPSSYQLHVCVMAAGSSIRPQVINCMYGCLNHQVNCMCGCWFRLSPQVINCMMYMMYVSWLLDPASITIA